ncbi:MAG: DinB family protein [Pyrinomonadaceae bacterium]
MNYQNIAEVYAANSEIRENLKNVVENLTDERAGFLPEGEKWTVAALVEHLAIVENSMIQISAKLLTKAQAAGAGSDGKADITGEFLGKLQENRDRKFEAPEIVHPTGTKTIAESLQMMDENRRKLDEMRPLFESVDCSDFKFPHPAFGPMNAHEWLALIGGHEARHTAQIVRLLEKTSNG